MSGSLILGCLWVIAAAIVAMLPMRGQRLPGLMLLVAAPVLIGFIGWQNGWIWAALGLFAFVSMFRRPLAHVARRTFGRGQGT
ncbi:MAG: DUF2484 family protein [Pseudomonadota bacterium]